MEQRAATKNDWPGLMPMGSDPIALPLDVRFNERQMHNLRLGFIPSDQNEKWFLYFDDSTLHIHRSWTGLKVFEVLFKEEEGHWLAFEAIVNLDPDAYSGDLQGAEEMLLQLLRDFASDEAHEFHQSSFVGAMQEAAKPGYLGSPSVVLALVAPLLQKCFAKELAPHIEGLEKATYNDVLASNQQITAAICGDDQSYHGLDDWRTEKGLGAAIVRYFGLDADWYADENLHCIVSEGLAGVSLRVKEIISEFLKEEDLDTYALIDFLKVLQGFVASVLMGTNSVLFPNVDLSDFRWESRADFVSLDEAEAEVGDIVVDEEIEAAGTVQVERQLSFDELLRQLNELSENEDEEDHNPEDDEDWDGEYEPKTPS